MSETIRKAKKAVGNGARDSAGTLASTPRENILGVRPKAKGEDSWRRHKEEYEAVGRAYDLPADEGSGGCFDKLIRETDDVMSVVSESRC